MIHFHISRVLTHSDDTFYEICKPNLTKENLKVEEDKMKISWMPADIERWLHTGTKDNRSQRAIDIDSYEVSEKLKDQDINGFLNGTFIITLRSLSSPLKLPRTVRHYRLNG